MSKSLIGVNYPGDGAGYPSPISTGVKHSSPSAALVSPQPGDGAGGIPLAVTQEDFLFFPSYRLATMN